MDKKITKRELYTVMLDFLNAYDESVEFSFPEGISTDSLKELASKEIEMLDNKAAAAQKKAAEKKAAGDVLREKVFSVLSTDKYMTIAEITAAVGDPDVSSNMVTSRLTQLIELDRIEKDRISVTVGEKSKKVNGYKIKVDEE